MALRESGRAPARCRNLAMARKRKAYARGRSRAQRSGVKAGCAT